MSTFEESTFDDQPDPRQMHVGQGKNLVHDRGTHSASPGLTETTFDQGPKGGEGMSEASPPRGRALRPKRRAGNERESTI